MINVLGTLCELCSATAPESRLLTSSVGIFANIDNRYVPLLSEPQILDLHYYSTL